MYGAWDPQLDRQVAIKVLRRRGADAEARLLREARVVAKLRHPNIVQIHDVGRADDDAHGGVFLVMEYLPGGDLTSWLARAPRPWRDIVRTYVAVARSLAAAHLVDVVHRDVKPSNVLMGPDGQPRVVDFGLAQGRDAQASGLQIVGTPPYMAPEQHRGEPSDGRADQYALGVSVYEGLAGRRPFVGNASALLRAKERAAYPALEGVPRRVVSTIARALGPEPEQRFANMQAFALALEDAANASGGRRWWIATVAATAAMVGAARLAATDPCELPEGSPAEIWSQRGGALVGDAVEPESIARIDAVTQSWSRAWQEVCVDSRADGELSSPLREAQRQCLHRQSVAFAAASDELQRQAATSAAGAPTTTIEAAALASAIEPIMNCSVDAIAVMDPRAAALWGPQAAWEQVGRARVLHALGRDADALAVLRRGWIELTTAGDAASPLRGWSQGDAMVPLLAARLHLETARVHAGLGEFESAKHAALESLWRAEPARDHTTAAAAWLEFAWIEGVERQAPDSARWLAFTAAAVARAGDNPWLLAELSHLRGGMHYRAGRLAAAEEHYRVALAEPRALVGAHHPWTARTLNHLGNTLFEAGRLDEAIESSTAALESRRETLAPQHPLIAAALNNLAGMVLAGGDAPRAKSFVEQSLALLDGHGGPHELFARVLQGRVEQAMGDDTAAAQGYRAALGVRMASVERSHPAVQAARESLAALSLAPGARLESVP